MRRRADQPVAPSASEFHEKAEPDDEVNRRFSDLGGERRRTVRLKGCGKREQPDSGGLLGWPRGHEHSAVIPDPARGYADTRDG